MGGDTYRKRALSARAKATGGFLIVSVAGMAMLAAGFWNTNPDPETPGIKSVFPARNAADASESSRVQVTFHHPFPSALDNVSLRLWDAHGDRIIGAFEVHSSQTAAMLAPTTRLASGKYTAEARIGGNEAIQWEFSVSKQQTLPASTAAILVIKSDAIAYDDY